MFRITRRATLLALSRVQMPDCFLSSKHQDFLAVVAENSSEVQA